MSLVHEVVDVAVDAVDEQFVVHTGDQEVASDVHPVVARVEDLGLGGAAYAVQMSMMTRY